MTKILVLISLMKSQSLIQNSECAKMKEFVLVNEKKAMIALASFVKQKSLLNLRSELRGHMGLPRVRPGDSPHQKQLSTLNYLSGSRAETPSTSKSIIQRAKWTSFCSIKSDSKPVTRPGHF